MEAPSCLPEELKDTLEDIIRDAVLPLHLAEPIVAKIAQRLREAQGAVVTPGAGAMQVRIATLRSFLNICPPGKWSVLSWWALQFALGADSIDGMSPKLACTMLRIQRAHFSWHVTQWRKKLHLAPDPNLKRESRRIAGRRQREKPR
jgi:hypothetical protein